MEKSNKSYHISTVLFWTDHFVAAFTKEHQSIWTNLGRRRDDASASAAGRIALQLSGKE
jgi:hypothetical protein